MLDLPTVTLCCVDTRAPALAGRALARCLAGVRFADAVLLTDAARAGGAAPPGVRVVDVRIPSAAAYSAFVLKELAAHVHTPHVLVVQWDGFVLRPDAWDPAFLDFDYVGPRWPDLPPERSVGNGGFSLRSRALLDALQDPAVAPSHPEDLCICHVHRERLERDHGVRFAPPALADRFGFERAEPAGPSFGFHGVYHFPRVLGEAAVREVVPALPPEVVRGRDGRDLCRSLIRAGQLDSARALLRRRRALGLRSGPERSLALQIAWARCRRWTRGGAPTSGAAGVAAGGGA